MKCRGKWILVLAALATGLFSGCGGGGSGSSLSVDPSYTFTGAQPGVATRSAGHGLLTGTLTSSQSTSVSGVTVTLYHLVVSRQSTGSLTTTSNSNGVYYFGNLEPGRYRVVVQSQSADVTVSADADTSHNFQSVTSAGSAQYKWTIMVYLDADNDLEPFGPLNVNQMESLADNDQVAIVVLMDRITGQDSSAPNWVGARRFRVRHDSDTNTMTSAKSSAEGGSAEVLGAVDMGSAATLASFITWAQQHYPAEHYALDLWDHGSGILGRSRAATTPSLTRGLLWDDTSGTHITTAQLGSAFANAAKIDVLLFDLCSMQMMEMAYQIRSYADIMVGSEDLTPGDGYPYHQIFDLPVSTPTVTPEAFAAHVVSGFTNYYTNNTSVCQSALRISQVANLTTVLGSYATLLQSKLSTQRANILTARAATQFYGGGEPTYEGYRDLVDFVTRVASVTGDSDLAAGRDTVKAAVNAALIANGRWGSTESGSNGLTIFVPSSTVWHTWRTNYLTTAWAQNTNWDAFIDALYAN